MPAPKNLPNTKILSLEGDLAVEMIAGIDRFLMRELEVQNRTPFWQPDFSSHDAYTQSLEPNRQRLREILGLIDNRLSPDFQITGPPEGPPELATGPGYRIDEARWSVLQGVTGEGLLLTPHQNPIATVIALPDCDLPPEAWAGLDPEVPDTAQVARRLAEHGCRVLVPFLIDRKNTYARVPHFHRQSQPHREFLYRAAYELGRHIIGYEIHKIQAAVDAFTKDNHPIAVFGHGEGGLLAFYAAAIDTRIRAAAISGYFQPRETLWQEPIYRNLFGLLREFGDAEIAGLIAPRALIVEAADPPTVHIPSKPPEETRGPTPGSLIPPPFEAIEAEFNRACKQIEPLTPAPAFTITHSKQPGNDQTLTALLQALGSSQRMRPPANPPVRQRTGPDPKRRSKRQFTQLVDHIQNCLQEAEFARLDYWSDADDTDLGTWQKTSKPYRERFWNDVIGPLPEASLPPNPRSRLVYDQPKYRGYEVVLDVHPDVFAYGILLVPKRIRKGQRRPVVVCQHGLEGRPQNLADPTIEHDAYHQVACRLAERGFITYSPQNPYIGGDTFRVLQRKANPLKLSLFSFIVRQHEQTLHWLASLPFVDPDRIAFYGLSYGGKAAMRVPAILEQYCLSICSADFNEWIWKNASTRHRYSYMCGAEYEMFEFNLGNTFNYAEMSWLICPRPFMVERGHHDGVAPDEWVAYEFAKTRRRYVLFGIGDRAEIEFFDGPHTIHGVGTFQFLHKHLDWPEPKQIKELL
ncbi:MAG: hypothetical protein O7G87_20630 [bacterium]|nr:hypothetical protein [bacterium]